MAESLTTQQLMVLMREDAYVKQNAFAIIKYLSCLVGDERKEQDARQLLLRALEKRPHFGPLTGVIDSLAAKLGYFPYIADSPLTSVEQLLLETHRPINLDDIVYHKVQARVYNALMDGSNVILSAPTSFGKSLIIDGLVSSGRFHNVMLIVPTIALIDETRKRLARFKDHYRIITHPSQDQSQRNLFVLTQERACELALTQPLDMLIVDEFYKLHPSMDPDRAMMLNNAFYMFQKRAKQFYLLGPGIEGLAEKIEDAIDVLFIRTDYSTVISEVVRVDTTPGEFPALVDLCRGLTEPTLIFCSSPARASLVASALVDAGVGATSTAFQPAIEWLESEYHRDWIVTRALAQGIGLHHARIPRPLAQYMVRAFNDERIPFLICTSTLIEGVNTKAKNVIVFDNTIARKAIDYFTFNNVRGRSGRMFQHFTGYVYLFHEPPAPQLPGIDIPAITQTKEASTALLLQFEEGDLSLGSKERLEPILRQDVVPVDVLRACVGIPPENLIDLATEISQHSNRYHARLSWQGMPTSDQLRTACDLIWLHLKPRKGAGVLTAKQLAFKVNLLRTLGSPAALLRNAIEKTVDPSEAVETTLEFIRNWATFNFPRYLRTLDKVQRSVFGKRRLRAGNYDHFAILVENLFLEPPLMLLEDYGIPIGTIKHLEGYLHGAASLDEAIKRMKVLDVKALKRPEFEKELVAEAQKYF